MTYGMGTRAGRGQLRDKRALCSQEPVLRPRGSLGYSTELRFSERSALSCVIPRRPGWDAGGEQLLLLGQSVSQGRGLSQGDHALHILDSTLR